MWLINFKMQCKKILAYLRGPARVNSDKQHDPKKLQQHMKKIASNNNLSRQILTSDKKP